MIPRFPVEWSERGIVLHLQPPLLMNVTRDPFDTTHPFAVLLEWFSVTRLEAVYPWPHFRVTWSGGRKQHEFGPVVGAVEEAMTPSVAPLSFAEQVAALFEVVHRLRPDIVRLGWLAEPEVAWEPVERFPRARGRRERLGAGAFRSTKQVAEEEAVAIRPRSSAWETFVDWMASTPDCPFRSHPREVRVSREHLYAELTPRHIVRLPLSTLRARVGLAENDAVYWFGRRTPLVLPYRRRCPVGPYLDRRLAALSLLGA